MREGLTELFTINRLGLPSALRRCLGTTNLIHYSHSALRGTRVTFKAFYEDHKEDSQFIDAKGPDFVSRLRGSLDIRGIDVSGQMRPADMFQRAILLRSLLERNAKWTINDATGRAEIDDDVTSAFLRTPSFKHGVRSMEAIINMSTTSLSRAFRKSSLPIREQLEMHVNALQFLDYAKPISQ